MQSQSLETKQTFLRTEVIHAGLDPDSFTIYLGSVKGQGQAIDLNNWTLKQLKKVIQEFKQICINESRLLVGQKKEKSIAKQDKSIKNEIPQQFPEKKVFYEKDDLWDYQLIKKEQCKVAQSYFKVTSIPSIKIQKVQLKKTSGYFFGIGGKYYMEFTLFSNFFPTKVVRKSQDVDWLRATLLSTFPGIYIPSLPQSPIFEPQNRQQLVKRQGQIKYFLNTIINIEELLNNRHTHSFLTIKDEKVFENIKNSKMNEINHRKDFKNMQNLDGFVTIQISQRIQQFIAHSSKYCTESFHILRNIQENFRNVEKDLLSLTKHYRILSDDFGKLKQKYNNLIEKTSVSKLKQMSQERDFNPELIQMFEQLRTNYLLLQVQSKKEAQITKEINEQNIRIMIREWSDFSILQKKQKNETDAYYRFKSSYGNKKSLYFNELHKKQAEQRLKNPGLKQFSYQEKQNSFVQRYPNDQKLEQDKRIWQGYINSMYEKSFKSLVGSHGKRLKVKLSELYETSCVRLYEKIQLYKTFLQK